MIDRYALIIDSFQQTLVERSPYVLFFISSFEDGLYVEQVLYSIIKGVELQGTCLVDTEYGVIAPDHHSECPLSLQFNIQYNE